MLSNGTNKTIPSSKYSCYQIMIKPIFALSKSELADLELNLGIQLHQIVPR